MRRKTLYLWPIAASVMAAALLSISGCAGTPEFDAPLGNSPRGAVFLERIPDRSFQATHPTAISPSTLRTALQGILIENAHVSLSTLLSDKQKPAPAFSEAEAAFLAPLLSDGLRQAASDQQIGFTLTHQDSLSTHRVEAGAGVGSAPAPLPGSVHEESTGSVFVHGRSLHIQFRRLHFKPERPDAVNMPNRRLPDPTGLTDHVLSFALPSARRPASYVIQGDAGNTLVLDYEQLAGLTLSPSSTAAPNPVSPTVPPASPNGGQDADLRTLQEQMRQKDREMESLRKELQDIRQYMNRQPTEPTSPTSDRPR